MSTLFHRAAIAFAMLVVSMFPGIAAETHPTSYRTATVNGLKIFYREAGDPKAPAILLLHGFPSSSHQYRSLIPLLADRYHVVAPDYPGFGFSDAPDRAQFKYSFENLATVMNSFTQQVGLDRFAVYVFDYGGPIGFRMAVSHPERITAIISQNGNIYAEGLSANFDGLKKVWADPAHADRNAVRPALTPAANDRRYFGGVPEADKPLVAPESYTLDNLLMQRPGNDEIQIDLLADYGSNVALYPAFQDYLRQHKPPLLAIWGKYDGSFIPAGAEAFRRDAPDAEIHLIEAGHFALETRVEEIAAVLRSFLGKHLKQG